MRVSIIGTGYVGLVTGACLAELGHEVRLRGRRPRQGATHQRAARADLRGGPAELLERHVGHAAARHDRPRGGRARHATLTLIAVGTPFDERRIDLGVRRAGGRGRSARRCARRARTTWWWSRARWFPGTTDGVVRRVLEQASGKRAGDGFGLGMNPEFLTEGQAVGDFMEPGPHRRSAAWTGAHRTAARGALRGASTDAPRSCTNPRTAEMIKYASNALLATRSRSPTRSRNLCAALGGVDVVDVMHGVHVSRLPDRRAPDGGRARHGRPSRASSRRAAASAGAACPRT